ncbi:MAG: imidazole glycerol phosphate synthase, glutamine amidotransferase subunit [Elusimicrobia bacterium RIFOXYA2_FULL_39_19]|nr:MAG: imidazole glycerol phosphate synthase, glutamine amidotransferase subunit [Elusimicrobia bacterium RIFOXYA2_FULL_39_19]
MIAIIDYGVGNLRSITKSVEILGGNPVVTTDMSIVAKADGIILPGVGAFKPAIKMLKESGLLETIKQSVSAGKPVLGICLGMQLFFSQSSEGGKTKGMCLIDGTVEKLSAKVKLPQMGWNEVKFQISNIPPLKKDPAYLCKTEKSQTFKNVKNNSYFYFVHSYYCKPKNKKTVTATTNYGITFPSIVQKNNIIGMQFHPEKSSQQGLKLLANFVQLTK